MPTSLVSMAEVAFSFYASQMWDNLLQELELETVSTTFMSRLKTYLFAFNTFSLKSNVSFSLSYCVYSVCCFYRLFFSTYIFLYLLLLFLWFLSCVLTCVIYKAHYLRNYLVANIHCAVDIKFLLWTLLSESTFIFFHYITSFQLQVL